MFGLLSVAAGVCAYLTVAYFIEATSHTVPLKPVFYVFGLGWAVASVAALRMAWRDWKGWSIPAFLALMTAMVFVLYLLFFLPFP